MSNITSLESLQTLLLSAVYRPRFVVTAYALGAFLVILKVVQATRHRLKTTPLRGPPSPSFIWGVSKTILLSPDSAEEYEKWAEEYGGVYEIPTTLGGRHTILCDPKAITHLFGGEPWTYTLPPIAKIPTEHLLGKSIFSAAGEKHRRQRKALTPAFSNAAIRDLTPTFYDAAYKVKGIWDSLIESNGGCAIIDAQKWMNRVSLDTIGIAGFSHDFGTLDGKSTSATEVFDAFGATRHSTLLQFLFLFAQAFPLLLSIPTPRSQLVKRLNDMLGEIVNALLTKSRKEKVEGTLAESEEKSILGLLIRVENQGGDVYLTREEVITQAKVLLLAGYESTSISMTWALIELAKNPDIQSKLRAELLEFGADPTYDQLPNNLPYLDVVVHETLRLHPPVQDFFRMAAIDDVIPLSKPVHTRSGKLVDHISVAKGTPLFISARATNRSTELWGPDAKEFKPERWLSEAGIPARAKEIQGHRHLLTFIDGPRTCIGKGFAITEFKIVLSILVKNFVFELRDGPETVIESARGVLPRPRVAGEQGTAVPMRVRRFE